MADVEESPAQRQARLRREKREKKILDGGSDRLAKITGMSGRTVQPEPSPVAQIPASQNPTSPSVADDPDEADIRTASYPSQSSSPSPFPPSGANGPSEADLRNFLRGAQPPSGAGNGTQQAGEEPDMMAMLQQLMAGGGQPGAPGNGGPGGAGGPDMAGLPPALAAMLGGAGGAAGMGPAPQQAGATNAYIWKIMHFVSALSLALYILVTYPFAGTLAARSIDPSTHSLTPEEAAGGATQKATTIFYIFATMQLVLQSSRFFLEQGREEGGMVSKVAGFLPHPWGARVRLASRYSGIWFTLAGDAMVVVFVLGVVAWWRGVGA